MATEPPRRPTGGMTVLLMLVLAVIVAALLIWGWSSSNPNRPHPQATARPATMPAGAGQPPH